MSRPGPGAAVDWQFAAAVGARLARPGPATTEYTRRQVIDDLAAAARAAEAPVRAVTGLSADAPVREARIVDRPDWIRAASDSMRVMAGPAAGSPGMVTGRLVGAQTGAVLAYVAAGILGQYDPFADGGGTLLLVYPNVVAAERQLRLPAKDFRMWVCLHEVTHRVQFTANPWLLGYMAGTLAVLTEGRSDDLAAVAGRLAGIVKGRSRDQHGGAGVLDVLRAVLTEPQRDAMDRLLVLGTLLEGHADHVMDAVGPDVVPAVGLIRRRFDDRRHRRQPPVHRLLRAVLGVDAKLSQYTRGKAFVDDLVSRVGMHRFNTVWSGPETLPRPEEIEDPQRWIARVL